MVSRAPLAQLIKIEPNPDTDALCLLGIERDRRHQAPDENENGPVFSDRLRTDLIGTAAQRLFDLENQILSR